MSLPLLGLLCGNGVQGVGVPALVPQELTGRTETRRVGSGYCWEDLESLTSLKQ